MRTVIIDDDRKSIRHLTLMLQKYCSRVEIVAEAYSGLHGLEMIAAHNPELVFLDILMPGMSGFDMLAAINEYTFGVIFVSGYETYGIKAIKFSALDYILKPLDVTELIMAVTKAERRQEKALSRLQVENLLAVTDETRQAEHRIHVNHATGTDYIKIGNIIMCQSDNNYTLLHLNPDTGEKHNGYKNNTCLTSKALFEYRRELSAYHFIQPHASWFVNLCYVTGITRDSGISQLVLRGTDTTVPIAKNRLADIRMELDNYHRR